MMKNLKFTLFFCLSISALSACGTTQVEDFNDIKPGMTKTEVLDELGSPFRSDRVNGVDVWTYRFYEEESPAYREVQIKDDYVTYAGETTGKSSDLFPAGQSLPRTRNLEKELKVNKKPKPAFEDVD